MTITPLVRGQAKGAKHSTNKGQFGPTYNFDESRLNELIYADPDGIGHTDGL